MPLKSDYIDSNYIYEGNDLGLTLRENLASFKCWSPFAINVDLLLFHDATNLNKPVKEIKMNPGNLGVWYISNLDVAEYKYYKYRIENPNGIFEVCDIWSKCCSADSVASQITDINPKGTNPYVNPFGNTGEETKKYSDAVIYEMHIRDWSRAFEKNSTGKYRDITKALNSPDGFAAHLKDLGITHVQILPMFDYAQTNKDQNYNWGYNPYHYNVPEGRYVEDMKDGTDAVLQVREMVNAFHENGIAVVMDVVYNHTNSTGSKSIYDMTIPDYFYRLRNGNYSDGSGCGNEVATNHLMVKKYVIDSLKHWMLDYHINGFRFDLMGCIESQTMRDIYKELYKIDRNVLVYGEPWTGGDSAVKSGAIGATKALKGIGCGAFDDDFRDAIKGAEFGGFAKGQVQGEYRDEAINRGLIGATGYNGRNNTGDPQLSIHYVECHDNYTLFDKLSISLNNGCDATGWKSYEAWDKESQSLLVAEDKLAAAYVILSQGTIFLNGGQEFLRTKKGNPDSYAADFKGGVQWINGEGETNIDSVNEINLELKDLHYQVFNTYRGLLRLRKDFSECFGNRLDTTALTLGAGVTKYNAGNFVVLFNATENDFNLSENEEGFEVEIDSSEKTLKGYSVSNQKKMVEIVPKKSFIVLKLEK